MKRIALISVVLFILCIFGCFGLPFSAAQAEEAQDGSSPVVDQTAFVIGSDTYTVNGAMHKMEVSPYIQNSRTFLPLRYVAYAIGIEDQDIIWHGDTQSIMLIKGLQTVELTIGSKTITINSVTTQQIDAAPEIRNGRTCLPVALVARAFGATVDWDAASQQVTVTAADSGDQQALTEGSVDERLALYRQAQSDYEQKWGGNPRLGSPYGVYVSTGVPSYMDQQPYVGIYQFDPDADEVIVDVSHGETGTEMKYQKIGIGQWQFTEWRELGMESWTDWMSPETPVDDPGIEWHHYGE